MLHKFKFQGQKELDQSLAIMLELDFATGHLLYFCPQNSEDSMICKSLRKSEQHTANSQACLSHK